MSASQLMAISCEREYAPCSRQITNDSAATQIYGRLRLIATAQVIGLQQIESDQKRKVPYFFNTRRLGMGERNRWRMYVASVVSVEAVGAEC